MSETEVSQSAVVLNINAELPVINESTTSRVILSNPLLRVVDFTFDTGQLLTEHTSPRAVVVTLLDGEMDFKLEGESHIMHAGDMIYLAPGAPHALTAITPCRLQLVMVDTTSQA
ncbi:MAG: cupin domain-containing protein [Propionibacterium sp.]|nr:cupin domain-containing protein [Propionibacterium sp.]